MPIKVSRFFTVTINEPDKQTIVRIQNFNYDQPFRLESGKVLNGFNLAYSTSGSLNAERSNIVWVFHAFTADSNAQEWWSGLIGNGQVIDPERYFIICVNMPGSCYGSIGPLSINPHSGEPYFHDFPLWTIRDMVRAYQKLKNDLQISSIYLGIGGSMGGQQLLEWAIEEPRLFRYICPVATNARHSSWGIAFNATQRICIINDITWKERHSRAGINGMKAARSIAILSYRNYDAYEYAQQGLTDHSLNKPVDEQVPKAETYQIYQGEKLAKRFNAFSYYFLSRSMDTHDTGRGRGGLAKALKTIRSRCLVISMKNDYLFPETEQQFLKMHIKDAYFKLIPTVYGHDGFLTEAADIGYELKEFLEFSESFGCVQL